MAFRIHSAPLVNSTWSSKGWALPKTRDCWESKKAEEMCSLIETGKLPPESEASVICGSRELADELNSKQPSDTEVWTYKAVKDVKRSLAGVPQGEWKEGIVGW